MTEQQRPDEDVEGHGYRWSQDTEVAEEDQVADDTQGHGRYSETEEDVEGHGRTLAQEEGSADDVAGHGRFKMEDEASEDDVEGHSPARRPL